MSSHFEDNKANVDEFMREMVEESGNISQPFGAPNNDFDFSNCEIPGLSAAEMSYLHEVVNREDGLQAAKEEHESFLNTQQVQEENALVGEDDFYGEGEEKEQEDNEATIQQEFEKSTDDSSDVGDFDEDDLHRELLLAGRRGNRLGKFKLTKAIDKATLQMTTFKDGEWASYKTEKEDLITDLMNDKAKLKERLKELRRAGEGVSTHAEFNAVPQPWPTKIMDLPQGDSILVEFQKMMSTVNTKYNDLQRMVNDLQSSLNSATGINDKLQTEINRWKAIVEPFHDQVNSNNQLIGELQEEVRRLTDTESQFKSEVSRLESSLNDAKNELVKMQQHIIDSTSSFPSTPSVPPSRPSLSIIVAEASLATQSFPPENATAELAAAIQRILNLEAEKETDMEEDSKRLGAAQFEIKESADKVLALEKELMKPRANEYLLAEAQKSLGELNDLKEENKKLRRASYNVVQGAKREVERLRDTNFRLVHKMDDPYRKIALREAYFHFQNMPEPAEKVVIEAVELVQEEEVVMPREVPGAWSETDMVDISIPSPMAAIASVSCRIRAATCRKIDAARNTALHIKFTAKYFLDQWKITFFWMFVAFLALLNLCGKYLLDEEPEVPTPKACFQPKLNRRNMGGELVEYTYGMHIEAVTVISAASTTSAFPSPTAAAAMLGIGLLLLFCRHLIQPTPMAQDRKFTDAERVLEAAVRASVLKDEERKAEEAAAGRRQWQEAAARQPEFFESLHASTGETTFDYVRLLDTLCNLERLPLFGD